MSSSRQIEAVQYGTLIPVLAHPCSTAGSSWPRRWDTTRPKPSGPAGLALRRRRSTPAWKCGPTSCGCGQASPRAAKSWKPAAGRRGRRRRNRCGPGARTVPLPNARRGLRAYLAGKRRNATRPWMNKHHDQSSHTSDRRSRLHQDCDRSHGRGRGQRPTCPGRKFVGVAGNGLRPARRSRWRWRTCTACRRPAPTGSRRGGPGTGHRSDHSAETVVAGVAAQAAGIGTTTSLCDSRPTLRSVTVRLDDRPGRG